MREQKKKNSSMLTLLAVDESQKSFQTLRNMRQNQSKNALKKNNV